MTRFFSLFKQAWSEFSEDHAQRLGAALAYYTIFSIAPLLLIAISIAGIFFGKSNAQTAIVAQLHTVLGSAAADAITEMLKNAAKPKSGSIATIVGIVTLLLGAAGVFGQLKDALNAIWNVEPKKSGGLLTMLRQRFLSMAMVLGVGFLLLVTLVVDTAISAMGHWIGARIAGGETLLQIIQLVVSFAVVTLLFAMIFRFLPDTKIEWRDVWFGAAFTALLFVAGKFALALWLGKGTVGSAYGAAGSLVVILVWVYWSAQILFYGAEFTQVYARAHGSRVGGQAGDRKNDEVATSKAGQRPAPHARPPALPGPAPAARPQRATGTIAASGAVGLFAGTLVGAAGFAVFVVKAVKRLVT